MDQLPAHYADRSVRVLIEPAQLPGRLVVAVVARSGPRDAPVDRLLVRRSIAGDLKGVDADAVLFEVKLALVQASESLRWGPDEVGPESPRGD